MGRPLWAVLDLSYSIGLHGHKGNNKHSQLIINNNISEYSLITDSNIRRLAILLIGFIIFNWLNYCYY